MIVVDLETTGLDPRMNSILSIGAVDFSKPESQFYGECGLEPGKIIDPVALRINGFSEKAVLSNPKPVENLVAEFIQWAKKSADRTLAGYYIHFDQSFLMDVCRSYGLDWIFGVQVVDIHGLFYAEMLKKGKLILHEKTSPYTLDYILNSVGLPTEPHPHNALVGAKMTAEAFSRFIFGRKLLKEFDILPARKMW